MGTTKTILWLLAVIVIVIGGCTRAHHGTFVPSTYTGSAGSEQTAAREFLRESIGESSQTFLFYVFPKGDPASTSAATTDAKSQYPGTKFLLI